MAATLWAGEGSQISHQTAAALWEMEGIVRPAEIHLTMPRARVRHHESLVTHSTADLLPADVSVAHGIPVTSPLRTVLDLAGVLDEEALQLVIEDCLRRRLFTVGQLEWRHSLRKGKGVPGSKVIGALIARHGSVVTDSGWEVRLEQLLVAEGWPLPQRQLRVRTDVGTVKVDLGYEAGQVVAFEYDSDRWHSGVKRRHDDMERRNALRAVNVIVVEVNAAMMRDPKAFIALVRPILLEEGLSCGARLSTGQPHAT